MIVGKRIAVVGSRKFKNYAQIETTLDRFVTYEDIIVSGGASGVDSFAQRYAKERGHTIHIYYPRWENGSSAGFKRNRRIVEGSDTVFAFYSVGRFQQGGTANTIDWCRRLDKPYYEIEENIAINWEEINTWWNKTPDTYNMWTDVPTPKENG